MIEAETRYILVLIEDDIRRLWEQRELYRLMTWTDWYAENRAQIRALVSVLRRARMAVR